MAGPAPVWTTEDPATLQTRVENAKASFSTPLKKFLAEYKVHDFVICWLHDKKIVLPWEVAGLCTDVTTVSNNVSLPAGLQHPQDIQHLGRTNRLWAQCNSFSDSVLAEQSKAARGNNSLKSDDFDVDDTFIDSDTRTKAELAFEKRYNFRTHQKMQPHDKVLGMIKHDLEACNLRTIPLTKIYLQNDSKKSTKRKKIEGTDLEIVLKESEEANTGGIYENHSKLRAMLIGYAWIGGLDEHRVLDPNDERPEAVRNANPRYIPLLDYTTLLNYCEHFMRACTSPLQGSTQRPSLEVVLKAELETRDWACRLLRDAHLEGRSLSLSAALSQSLRHCNGYWHSTNAQSRSETLSSAKKEGVVTFLSRVSN